MLNTESYRSSTDYREILRILQRASSLQENLIWQTHAMGRTIIPVHHFEIDFVAREVVAYYDSRHYQLDRELSLYVKLDYRVSVFKITDFRQGQGTLHFAFPLEVKTQELRLHARHQFSPGADKFVTIRPSLTSQGRDMAHELTVRVFDTSILGLGVVVSEHNRSYLKNNRILWVTKFQDQILERPIIAEVVYINSEIDPKFQGRKQKDLKVGLKFSEALPDVVYEKFIR